MQEDNEIELTSRFGDPSDSMLDHQAAADDVDLPISESILDDGSPMVGVVANDEAESIERGHEAVEHSDDDDFEFTFAGVDLGTEWFPPGELFPIFDRRLLSESETLAIENDQMRTVRSALKNLFTVDDRNHSCDEETEAELDGIEPGSYCVWTPGNSPQASPARCKKSSSTGSTAKRWSASLRELLIRRSRSDGKASLVRFGNWKSAERGETSSSAVAEKDVVKVKKAAANGGGGGGEKRRATYLPYKKAIIGFGFYPSVNGFGGVIRNARHFDHR